MAWRSKSYRNESLTWARMMSPNSLILQKVKAAAKWSFFVRLPGPAHTAAPGAAPAPGTLLPWALPGCCLTYPHSKRSGDKALLLWQKHSVKSFLILRHCSGMEFEAITRSALDMPRRICSFYKSLGGPEAKFWMQSFFWITGTFGSDVKQLRWSEPYWDDVRTGQGAMDR